MAPLLAVLVLVVGLTLTGCSRPERGSVTAPLPAPPPGAPARPRPRLVVLIVVDQLPSWTFDRDRPLFTKGFARLLRDGAYVRAAELPYAHPFTAPGHASIATGAPPRVHGVIANTWYRRAEGREVRAELDRAAPVFEVSAARTGTLTVEDGTSGRALRVDGIADALRTAHGRARSVAIALKPRAATFIAGRRPDLAIWYEAAAGGMTTSRAYAEAVPTWLVELARTQPASRFFGAVWTARDPAALATLTGIADDAPGEGSVHGLDATFPHDLAATDNPSRAFLHTPYADQIVLDAALAAVDAMQLGADAVPDLLAISFNARDYAGHLWGPDSWEVLELTRSLDERLGELFDVLDRKLGSAGWAAVVTSDHGATRVVEGGSTVGARRVGTTEILEAAEVAVAGLLGRGPWVASVIGGNVYFSGAFAQQPAARRDAALTAAVTSIGKLRGIGAVGRVDQVTGRCDARTGFERLICASVIAEESGELYVLPARGSLISDYKRGSHHDAPSDDNRQVPILVLAPGLVAQTGTGTLLQIAPTVAALLGVPPPAAASEPPLFRLPR
ncbi:MAG: alkaline phosphatase family protein [Myxococcota bacterium]|nr:alkaline phosphatase family protein [Myxococcota bacterium]